MEISYRPAHKRFEPESRRQRLVVSPRISFRPASSGSKFLSGRTLFFYYRNFLTIGGRPEFFSTTTTADTFSPRHIHFLLWKRVAGRGVNGDGRRKIQRTATSWAGLGILKKNPVAKPLRQRSLALWPQ
jgi:hypothetical protein